MNNQSKCKFIPDKKTGRLSEDDSKRYFSTLGFAVSAYLLVTTGLSLLVSLAITAWSPELLENSIVSNLIGTICQYGVGLPVIAFALKGLPKDTNPSEKLSVGEFFGYFTVCLTFMSVGSNLSMTVMSIVEGLLGRATENPVASSTTGVHPLVNLVFFAIIAPIMEELIYRKTICDRLLPLGEGYTVILSAVIFALVHGNFYQFFYAFLVGMIFSYVYLKTGNIIYTTVFHMIINLMGGVITPWVTDQLAPLMTEENITLYTELIEKGEMEKLGEIFTPYFAPSLFIIAYTLIYNICAIIGFVVLMKNLNKVRFREGLLPPAKEGKVANIFFNGGVFTAIAFCAVMFVISLFP